MADKPIARLVGEIGFLVDNKALDQFFSSLRRTERQMMAMGKLADILAGKLGKLGGGSAARLNTKQLAADVARIERLLAQVQAAKSRAATALNKEALSSGKLLFASKQAEVKLGQGQLTQERQRLLIEKLRATTAQQAADAELRGQAARRRMAESTALYEQRARNLTLAGQERIAKVARQGTMLQQAQFRLDIQKAREAERQARVSSSTAFSRATPGSAIGRGAGFSLGPVGGFAALATGVGLATSMIGRWTAALQQSMAVLQGQQYAVSASAGGGQAGAQANAWLSKYADSRGLDRSAVSDQFAGFLASGKGAGLSNEQSQNTFAGFADLGTTLHLSSERQAGALRAVSQMLGKNQVQAEELRGQLSEHLPGAVSLFAEAWAKQTGSGKTEQAAIADLNAAMQKGLVKTQTVLLAAQIAAQRAAPTLAQSSSTAQAEANRATNRKNEFILGFAQAGGDAANAKVFRQVAELWRDLMKDAPQLARIYDNLASTVETLVLRSRVFLEALEKIGVFDGIEQLTHAFADLQILITNLGIAFSTVGASQEDLEGLLGRWLNPEEIEVFRKAVSDIQSAWSALMEALGTSDFSVFGTLNEFVKATAKEIVGLTEALATGINYLREFLQLRDWKERKVSMTPDDYAAANERAFAPPIVTSPTPNTPAPQQPNPSLGDMGRRMQDSQDYGERVSSPAAKQGSTVSNTSNVVNIGSGAIVVNAAEGQSPQDIANIVQDELSKSYAGLKAGQQITK